MNKKLKPNKKKPKTICGLRRGIFSRLQFVIVFEEDSTHLTMESSIFESYVPRVLSSCSVSCKKPENPLDVKAFERVTTLPGQTPYFQQPNLPESLPADRNQKRIMVETYPSLIPLLMTAKFSGIDTRRYHIITQRNSLRKLAMNDEDFAINIVRFESTLFLRRFASYRVINKNDVGFRFEEMCTNKSNSSVDYYQLIDGQIGKYKILMMGKTDAINRENGESIELKCTTPNRSRSDKYDWWLQAYLSK